ncbi:N-acetylmuramic acid 6-phosphate etherase [Algisphaera agarilytica]|uniref:N-acetylmuramic acid 6-phosphate etherase n=1 Tax=Algisphaera agarilytica TaxID=1385975 RepID=A0A7X0H7V4_9BACT|nr:N-acetylmuramic acid 6-phosphate etherase [Algisphaera agarilytica]MBB6429726.1 N-acetylmuramic acid 6-phosphate etherase [Algisphaera agarilytica]
MSDPSLDRSQLETEKRLASAAAIDALSVAQTLQLMNTQDIEVPRIVRTALPALTKLIERIIAGMREGGRLIYVGAGTSGRLGVLDASECPPTFFTDPTDVVGVIAGGDKALRRSAEGKEDDPTGSHLTLTNMQLTEHDTLVGIAAGGTTPFVWGAIEFARNKGAATGIITCVKLSTLRKPIQRAPLVPGNAPVDLPAPPEEQFRVDHPIELIVGPEVVTGSTRLKAGTATKLALNMITTTTMVQLGKTWGNLMVDVRATNDKLTDRAQRILMQQLGIDREAAGELLDQADGRVKLALVMHRKNLDAEAAEALIDEHGGKLRPILGSPK